MSTFTRFRRTIAMAAAGAVGALLSAAPAAANGPALRDPSSLRHALALTLHLARRDIAATNRMSVVGAAWPLLRQLAQLAILVFAFSAVLDLGIENYPAFVFCGLIGWSWFTAGMIAASDSVNSMRNFAMRPGFPTVVLPVLAVLVPFVDVLFALPVLAVMLALLGELGPSALLIVPLLALQGLLMVGFGWVLGSLAVFFRDIPSLVSVGTLMAFYVTPVFFDVTRIPEDYQWIIRLNPMAIMLEADRAVLLGTPFPPVGAFAAVVGLTALLLVGGYALFQRLAPQFADEL